MKQCKKCMQSKPETDFNKDQSKKDGLFAWCRSCHVANSTKWNKDNPEKYREIFRRHRKKHPRGSLSDTIKASLRMKNAIWDKANREKKNERNRRYRKLHPEKNTERHQVRRARILNAGGKFTAAQWKALKEKYEYTCLRCERREPEIKLTPDHVLPLSKGGRNDIENIQPLCISCNASKQAKHIDYRSKGGG